MQKWAAVAISVVSSVSKGLVLKGCVEMGGGSRLCG